jgi:hypothetical protein
VDANGGFDYPGVVNYILGLNDKEVCCMQEYEMLKKLVLEVEDDVAKAIGGNKAAGTRVRKKMQEIKAAASDIRKKILESREAEPPASTPQA